jgi:hypothetical protein
VVTEATLLDPKNSMQVKIRKEEISEPSYDAGDSVQKTL